MPSQSHSLDHSKQCVASDKPYCERYKRIQSAGDTRKVGEELVDRHVVGVVDLWESVGFCAPAYDVLVIYWPDQEICSGDAHVFSLESSMQQRWKEVRVI